MNKFNAVRTWDERWFDSKAEARRAAELRLLEKAGEISNLEYQIKFVLCDKPKVTITIDFRYFDKHLVYEDVKGVLTRDFRTKLAWLKDKYGIEVQLV